MLPPRTAREDPEPMALSAETRAFYSEVLATLARDRVPHLVAGAYALAHYTGIERDTKDFDLFVRQADVPRVARSLESIGCAVVPYASHWLTKAFRGDDFVDIIYSSGNGLAEVDDGWFAHAREGRVLGVEARLCPPEEMIWSKAFIMERERFDGADVAHLLHDLAEELDWERLASRFGEHWRVLLAHLVLFGFIYPCRRTAVPGWLVGGLLRRMREEQRAAAPERVCHGTLLSRRQYATDVEERRYRDGRLPPAGNLSRRELSEWQRVTDEEAREGDEEG